MAQVSRVLRRAEGRYLHWCPACEEMHQLPDGWAFDGNVDRPTFRPSFRHESRDPKLQGIASPWKDRPFVCHYTVTAGQMIFAQDCSHIWADKTVPMPDLPEGYRDG